MKKSRVTVVTCRFCGKEMTPDQAVVHLFESHQDMELKVYFETERRP